MHPASVGAAVVGTVFLLCCLLDGPSWGLILMFVLVATVFGGCVCNCER